MRRPPLAFLDTNVVLYALDSAAKDKQSVARQLCLSERVRVSPQVALEASRNLLSKFRYEKHEVGPALNFLLPLMHPTTSVLIERSWYLMARYDLSIWDAAVVASALAARCTVLYSEDFQHGQTIEGMKIVNPFL